MTTTQYPGRRTMRVFRNGVGAATAGDVRYVVRLDGVEMAAITAALHSAASTLESHVQRGGKVADADQLAVLMRQIEYTLNNPQEPPA